MSFENLNKKYQVKIIKELKHLPHVFKIRNRYGKIIKVITVNKDFINCEKNIGKSFNCFELKNGKLKETYDLYSVPQNSIFSIHSEKGLIKDKRYIKDAIISTLTNYELLDENLLITYNDQEIIAYNKFYKAQLYQFLVIYGSETIEIFEVPSPNPKLNLQYERLDEFKIHDHMIKFSNSIGNKAEVTVLYSIPGFAYLIYTITQTDITIKFPDDRWTKIILDPDKYYLLTYLKNIEEKIQK